MNGLEIQFLLGLFFFITGLSSLVEGNSRGNMVIFVSGLILLVLVYVRKSLFGI